MSAVLVRPDARPSEALLIEGYASLFGVEDRVGDKVRAGAFAAALRQRPVPMLLQHKAGALAGHWVRMVEDGRGLFVRGLVDRPTAKSMVRGGLNGLSIGFQPQVWTERPGGGRVLVKIDLMEVSLVTEPMLEPARFQVIAGLGK